MIIYPAIDLKDGKCVRLRHGDLDQVTIYNSDAGDQARQFAEAGASWIHCVDLDGAVAGTPVNTDAVAAILKTGLKLQLGGGIRDMARISAWLDQGVERVILGTVALKNPTLVIEAAKAYPGRIAGGADARDGMIAAEGWVETSTIPVLDLVRRFEDCGVAAVIFTDISRDGDLSGVNSAATLTLADAVSIPVIASGGVAGMADVTVFDGTSVNGVIIGRALYDGRINLAEAISHRQAG
ncbi:MAG: 1-(5-phosphoribosyl)-5-[(5-phosphoribosylamino)methylideneamino]imidazole-4-carboxamide isomerase [Candidatus Puniceispirillales bacterium]